jgi:hypothetical protein
METQTFHHEKKLKYFTMKNCNLQKKKKSFKRNQSPSRYYYNNSIITNLKFSTQKPKYIIFQKSSYKSRPIKLLLPSRGL